MGTLSLKDLSRWMVILGCVALFAACGDLDFFVFVNNTIHVDGEVASGAILVIGTPRDPDPVSVVLASGTLPPGMEIKNDGTVRGVPTESGHFEFTLDITEENGKVSEQPFNVDLKE